MSSSSSDGEFEEPENQPIQIDLTPEFKQRVRKLKKRYRNIQADIQAVLEKIQLGDFVGDRLVDVSGTYSVFKVRIQNRDIQKGKSAGYRLIYQVESSENVLLVYIYSKSDQDDIAPEEILRILKSYYGEGRSISPD